MVEYRSGDAVFHRALDKVGHGGASKSVTVLRVACGSAQGTSHSAQRLACTLGTPTGVLPRLAATVLLVSCASSSVTPPSRRVQKWGWSDTKEQSALLGGEYDLSDNLTVFAHAGGGKSDVKRMSDQVPRILNAAGDTSNVPGYYKFNVDRSTADVGMRGLFATGTTILSNIYHPVDTPKQYINAPKVLRISESELSGVALTDTLEMLDDRFQLTLGVRRQFIESRNYTAAGSVSSRYSANATTPLLGVVVKPWEDVSLYYNYVEGLSKGDAAPGTASNAGETFAPYESKQHELGVKYEHDTFMTTLALFQIEKPAGELGANGVYSVQAEQRNRGLELSVFGEVATGTRLMGGVTFLDGELTKSATAANQGNKPVGVPDIQANLWAEYDTPWLEGFTLTGGAIYTDS